MMLCQALCEQLCLGLLHPGWEARHGAAVALREVLRSQAACAGVRAPLAPDQPSGRAEQSPLWRSDLLKACSSQPCSALCCAGAQCGKIRSNLY